MARPDTSTVWNVMLSTIGVALVAVIGWLAVEVVALKAAHQGMSANRFTGAHGAALRVDITDITTDIDKRLSLSEKDLEWLRLLIIANHGLPDLEDHGDHAVPVPLPPPAAPDSPEQMRKYDIRGGARKEAN